MRVTNRRRTTAVVLAIALHIGFVLLLLGRRTDPAMSSDTAMQVSLVPALAKVRPPGHPTSVRRAPPILHRPVETPLPPREAPPVSVTPLVRAGPSPSPPAASDAGAAILQRALKGRLGCANPNLVALTETERAACDERLGQDVANVRAYPVISPKLKKIFDRTFECKPDDDWCLYRIGKGPYPGLAGMVRKKKKTDWD
nr:hypothetical protein [Phenylobacterium sp.]